MDRARRTSTSALLPAGTILGLVAAVLALGGCGPIDRCTVPEGEYRTDISDAGGNCPQRLVDTVTDIEEPVTVEENTACGQSSRTYEEELEDGCILTAEESIEGTEDGLEDGRLAITVSCPESNDECSHDFDVAYEKVDDSK